MAAKITPGQIVAIGAVGIVSVLVFRAVRAGATVLQAINPASDQNIVNRGFNELTGATDRGSSLGSDLFDFIQRLRGIPPFDPNAPIDDQDGASRAVQNQKPRPAVQTPLDVFRVPFRGTTQPVQPVVQGPQ